MDKQDLDLYRGDDAEYLMTFEQEGQPFTLKGARIDMHMRALDSVIKLSTETGNITIINDNQLVVRINHDDTQNQEWQRADYDLQMMRDGKIKTLVRGRVNLTHDITKIGA